MLEHCQIAQAQDGTWSAAGPRVGLTVQGKSSARLFKRRAMRPFAAGGARHECMLVGELDRVRCYVVERDGAVHIVLTREDLNPEFAT